MDAMVKVLVGMKPAGVSALRQIAHARSAASDHRVTVSQLVREACREWVSRQPEVLEGKISVTEPPSTTQNPPISAVIAGLKDRMDGMLTAGTAKKLDPWIDEDPDPISEVC